VWCTAEHQPYCPGFCDVRLQGHGKPTSAWEPSRSVRERVTLESLYRTLASHRRVPRPPQTVVIRGPGIAGDQSTAMPGPRIAETTVGRPAGRSGPIIRNPPRPRVASSRVRTSSWTIGLEAPPRTCGGLRGTLHRVPATSATRPSWMCASSRRALARLPHEFRYAEMDPGKGRAGGFPEPSGCGEARPFG
jgi:hypothetical protein